MGRILKRIFKGKEYRIIFCGLDFAGKSSLLYKMKFDLITTIDPTIGFNVEKIHRNKKKYKIWDLGGQYNLRQLWKYYFLNCNALVFVIDSSDRERIDEAKEEFDKLMTQDELKGISFLIYANKQDINGAMSCDEIINKLSLHKLNDRKWHIQPLVAIRGDGIEEGLDWISRSV
ncbi:hypothetical protein DICPUDRAFT_92653 [Dictyostelium purpureum]|uniref:ADP-ribosylation factor-like protein 11 n=1 Tax=Dictyostelium purpureum TaxID=5786 RepID=F0ZVA2_DICPU|nr:uncharacterized protein DICPUDRAFT_92653 [Dictyostelium purpureum]EGC32132.1 hypothetical protein DICPUDRAFT_92653 [Dictyostelium purpureum]|eukprot:XP_003291341.1 hypothetical protein DICPUDRAFT_92653 [Dictyostelium purpureum]